MAGFAFHNAIVLFKPGSGATTPVEAVSGMSNWEKTLGQICWTNCISQLVLDG